MSIIQPIMVAGVGVVAKSIGLNPPEVVPPANVLTTDDDDPLLTDSGDYLTTDNEADTVPTKLSDYRPFLNADNPTQFQTTLEADDNDNPSNFQPIMSATMPAEQVVEGKYLLEVSWYYSVNSTSRASYWRFTVNGSSENFLRVTSQDSLDINTATARVFADVPAGTPITIEAAAVLEAGGGISTLTVEARDMDITIECKQNGIPTP